MPNNRMPSLQRYYTPKEVATAWGVSCMTIYRLVKRGELEAVRVGQQWRIPESALMAK